MSTCPVCERPLTPGMGHACSTVRHGGGPDPTGRPPYGGEMVQDKTWTQLEVMAVRLGLRLVRADDGVSILTTDPTPVFIMSVMPGRLAPVDTDKLVRATTFQALNAIASLRP